jgi:hypothetical protein
MKSDEYSKMTNAETEPLRTALNESKKVGKGKKNKWIKIKDCFVNAAKKTPALISAFAGFIEKTPTVAKWISSLISGNAP